MDSYSLSAALLECACQRVGRASGSNFVLALEPFNFPGPGAVFSEDLYNRRRCFWRVHVSGTGGEAR